jgi:hypothetical protein
MIKNTYKIIDVGSNDAYFNIKKRLCSPGIYLTNVRHIRTSGDWVRCDGVLRGNILPDSLRNNITCFAQIKIKKICLSRISPFAYWYKQYMK